MRDINKLQQILNSNSQNDISGRRKLHIKPPEVPYVDLVGIDVAIESYNRLLTLPQNYLNDLQIAELKKELVKRNIITEDHEGPIDVS